MLNRRRSVFLLASLGLIARMEARIVRVEDDREAVCGDRDCVLISDCPAALKLAFKVLTVDTHSDEISSHLSPLT